MGIFDKRVLLRFFGHKTMETIGGRRKLQLKEIKNVYSSTDITGDGIIKWHVPYR